MAWIIFGSYMGFGLASMEGCKPVVLWTVRVVVIAGWCLMLLMIIGFFVAFDPLGGRTVSGVDSRMSMYQQQWEAR